MRLSDDTVQRPRLPAAAPLAVGVAVVLLSLWLLAPSVAVAQVQIDQVQSTTQQVEGASQSQIFVAQDEGGVSEGDVTALIPTDAPGITDADGNNATVFQDGNRNNVSILQAGTNNQASASQLGDDSEIAITQDGAGSDAVPFDDDEPAAGAAFDAIQRSSLVGSGSSNLAVAVHEGTRRWTGIMPVSSKRVSHMELEPKTVD